MPIKIPRLTPEELKQAQERKRERRRLLLLIDVKYGGIENAEGSWELNKFREMIGANEDGRKKKHEI